MNERRKNFRNLPDCWHLQLQPHRMGPSQQPTSALPVVRGYKETSASKIQGPQQLRSRSHEIRILLKFAGDILGRQAQNAPKNRHYFRETASECLPRFREKNLKMPGLHHREANAHRSLLDLKVGCHEIRCGTLGALPRWGAAQSARLFGRRKFKRNGPLSFEKSWT